MGAKEHRDRANGITHEQDSVGRCVYKQTSMAAASRQTNRGRRTEKTEPDNQEENINQETEAPCKYFMEPKILISI